MLTPRSVLVVLAGIGLNIVTMSVGSAAVINAALKTNVSSQYDWWSTVYRGVDGSVAEGNTFYGADTVTTQYWQSDLGGMINLDHVEITARGYNLHDRLDQAMIEVYDQNDQLVTMVNTGDWTASGQTRSFALPAGTLGRTVRVTRVGVAPNGLDIAEMKVFANDLSEGQPVIDVVNQHGATGSSGKLVDGLYDESHTVYGVANTTQVSWTIDLDEPRYIDTVQTFARSYNDALASRLSSFTIDILDGSKNLVLSSGVLNPGNSQPANNSDKQMVAWDVLGTQGTSVLGQYVRFSKPGDGTDNFDIAEARVYGTGAFSRLPDWATLVDEDFSDLALGGADGGTWTTSDPNGFELYNTSGGFSARAMSTTYGGAGGIPDGTPVPGGLEVLNVDADTTITLSVDLPGTLDEAFDGLLTFWAGQRISGGFGGFEHQIEIENVTDNRTLLSLSAIPNFSNGIWRFNAFSLDFLASDAGDTLELRFFEQAGNAARGLQIADLQLNVALVPEPSALALAVFGLLGLAVFGRRRKRLVRAI